VHIRICAPSLSYKSQSANRVPADPRYLCAPSNSPVLHHRGGTERPPVLSRKGSVLHHTCAPVQSRPCVLRMCVAQAQACHGCLQGGVQRKGAAIGLPLPGAEAGLDRPLKYDPVAPAGWRVVARDPSLARSCVGLAIVACFSCMETCRSTEAHDSYANEEIKIESYESALLSRKIVCQTRPPPTLVHKAPFL
jgi:hypothetical protein